MKKLIFLGLLSFLIAAVWQLPLSFAKPYAEKYVQGLELDHVNGTIWNGSAQNVKHRKQDFGHVSWKVNPLQSLTSLSLKTAFKINSKQLTAEGIAAITPSKKIILNNTNFDMDASYINNFQKKAKLSGELQGTINHAELEKNQLPVVDADIDWKQGTVSSMLLNLSAGDYHAKIRPNDNGLHIEPTSNDAPLQLSGTIDLSKDWIYKPNLKVSSKDQSIAGLLKFAGKTQPDGSTQINKSLDLKPFLNIQ
jgi:hypothetical protein